MAFLTSERMESPGVEVLSEGCSTVIIFEGLAAWAVATVSAGAAGMGCGRSATATES